MKKIESLGIVSIALTHVLGYFSDLTSVTYWVVMISMHPTWCLVTMTRKVLNENIGILPYDGNSFLGIHNPLDEQIFYKGKIFNEDEYFKRVMYLLRHEPM